MSTHIDKSGLVYRSIRKEDDPEIALVIRTVLEEHGLARPGTVYTDPSTDHISELTNTPGSCYYIVEDAGCVIGGCGIFPTEGLPEGCVELVKLYVLSSYRKRGIGRHLMQLSIDRAIQFGYRQVYLETLPELHEALDLYAFMGFKKLDGSLGNSGHFACDIWMLLQLD